MRALIWKEYRESLPFALLGAGVITAIGLWVLLAGEIREEQLLLMRQGLYQAGSAILFVVAVVLGTTAYAVEEEENTLEPLLARPITPCELFTAKAGVRLGVLALLFLYLAVLLLISGAWNIQIIRGELTGLARWLGAFSVAFFGFATSLHFGRSLRSQTGGLVTAILLFAALWVLLMASGLSGLFLDPEGGYRFEWVRSLLLPLAGGLLALGLASRERASSEYNLSRGVRAAAAALVAYGAVVWLLSITPASLIGTAAHPSSYRDYLSLRLAGPERSLEIMAGRMQGVGRPESRWITTVTIFRQVTRAFQQRPEPLEWTASYLLHASPPAAVEASIYSFHPIGPPRPWHRDQRLLLERMDAGWQKKLLAGVRQERFDEIESLLALHLAGAFPEPPPTEELVALLAPDRLPRIRVVAALLLIASGTEQPFGQEVLAETFDLLLRETHIAFWAPAMGERALPELRQRALGPDRLMRFSARAALRWAGSRQETEVVMRSLAMDDRPADTLPHEYLLSWARQEDLPELRSRAEALVADIIAQRSDYEAWHQRRQDFGRERGGSRTATAYRRQLTEQERSIVDRLQRNITWLDRYLVRLADFGEGIVVDLWEATRFAPPSLVEAGADWKTRAHFLLPTLARAGEAGTAYLEALAADPAGDPRLRWQARALLVHHGRHDHGQALVEAWREGYGTGDRFWQGRPVEALRSLAGGGSRQAAGLLIENAAEMLAHPERWKERDWSDYWGLDLWFWNTRLVEALRAGTGVDHGWDISAWHRWWNEQPRGEERP